MSIAEVHDHPVRRAPLVPPSPPRFMLPSPDRFAYLPFGVGARVCIGAFRVELLDTAPVMPVGIVTTQPERSPMFRITRRR